MRPASLHRSALLLSFLFLTSQLHAQTQNVWLQFLNPGDAGASTTAYTGAEQTSVLNIVSGYYAPFGGFSFSLTDPGGTRSIVQINAANDFSNAPLTGGIAQDIDFRNLLKSDQARVNIVGLLGGGGQPANNSTNRVNLTSFIAAHELGHLQGLRHGDSFGPIGSGLPTTIAPANGDFNPSWTGPRLANETGNRLMASPASVAQTLAQAAAGPTVTSFSERESVKLAHNQNPTVTNEQGGAHGSIATAQSINFANLAVANPLPVGATNFGKSFVVSTFDVVGRISATGGEQDWYSFTTTQVNTLMNIEVISLVLNGLNRGAGPQQNPWAGLDLTMTVTNNLGAAIPYYGAPAGAFNDDEFESFDPRLVDLLIPTPGTYFIQLRGFQTTTTGSYELFGYQFATAVPEPMTMGLLGSVILGSGYVWYRRRTNLNKQMNQSLRR